MSHLLIDLRACNRACNHSGKHKSFCTPFQVHGPSSLLGSSFAAVPHTKGACFF